MEKIEVKSDEHPAKVRCTVCNITEELPETKNIKETIKRIDEFKLKHIKCGE